MVYGVVIIRPSQSSLAGVGAGAELGNNLGGLSLAQLSPNLFLEFVQKL